MQAAQREEYNHALEHAIKLSNTNRIPLLTVFCLVDDYPLANISHYRFMLEGLQEVEHDLENRKIPFFVIESNPVQIIPNLAEDAELVIVDRDYQRMQRNWRLSVAKSIECPLHQVETN
ncbi:MAG: deoxyribodipyrimidine photo-lyase, partial [Candidatus Thorarchaeota archaeon]